MLRFCLVLLSVVAISSAGGCRSCSNCHDYGPPVANCHCHACGTHRAGSASDEVIHPEYYEEGDQEPMPTDDASEEEMLPTQSLEDGPMIEQPEEVR